MQYTLEIIFLCYLHVNSSLAALLSNFFGSAKPAMKDFIQNKP
jgi:hypothetical protein